MKPLHLEMKWLKVDLTIERVYGLFDMDFFCKNCSIARHGEKMLMEHLKLWETEFMKRRTYNLFHWGNLAGNEWNLYSIIGICPFCGHIEGFGKKIIARGAAND